MKRTSGKPSSDTLLFPCGLEFARGSGASAAHDGPLPQLCVGAHHFQMFKRLVKSPPMSLLFCDKVAIMLTMAIALASRSQSRNSTLGKKTT